MQHKTKKNNAATKDRTRDLQIFSLTLSQLSYHGLVKKEANIKKVLTFSKLLCLLSKEALKHISHYLENFFEKEYLFG